MVPKSDHLANPRFDKKPSAQAFFSQKRPTGSDASDTPVSEKDPLD